MSRIRVGPSAKQPTHDISLGDGRVTWGLKLKGGIRGVQETSQTPSTLLRTGGGKKFGDFDPTFSHLQQSTWHGGRGQEEFVDDDTRFFDGTAFTMVPGRLIPALQWRFAEGLYYADVQTPGAKRPAFKMNNDVDGVALKGTEKYMAMQFDTQNNDYTMKTVGLWVRKVGEPAGNLTMAIYDDSSSEPNAAQETKTVDRDTITDSLWTFHEFELTTGVAQTHPDTWWVVIYDDGTGTATNHWEVGYGDGNSSQAKSSSDGSTWSNSSKQIFFRVTAAKVKRKWHFFHLEGALYAVDEKDDQTTSDLYINGDRGKATAATSTVITDSNKSWTTDLWIGAWVRIIAGTGKGQKREITDNDGTTITTAAWDKTPSTDSEYVIYDTDDWTDITPAAGDQIDGVVKSVAVFDNIAIFAQGDSVNMLKMRWDPTSPGHGFDDDGTNKGDLVHTFYDPVDGPQVWRAIGGSTMQVSRSDVKAWGTDLAFGTGITVGEDSYEFTNLLDYNDQLWVLKEDSIWTVKNDRASRLNVGIEAMAESTNGVAAAAQNLFLYFNWSHSVERLYSGTLDDIGPWKGAGLPNARRGVISSLEPVIAWMFAGIDADTGTSSVLAWDGRGWHELFRAWRAGDRIRNIKWQACPGTNPRLWINIGGNVVSIKFPKDTLNPIKDTSVNYMHESTLETSTYTMGVERLPKFFKEYNLTSENLASGRRVGLDYQLDKDIGGSTWIDANAFQVSPHDNLELNLGNKYRIRKRLKLQTNDADEPPRGIATVLEGYARTPIKRQWNLRVMTSDLQRTKTGGKDASPRELYEWLLDATQSADGIRMRANDSLMDDIWVVVEPPTLFRSFLNTFQDWLGGTITLTLREA